MGQIRYVGRRTKEGTHVTRESDDGTSKPLPLRLDLAKKSPTGFEWGYNGSGPAQLALAMLADAIGDERAMPNLQRFKFAVVGRLPQMGWILTQDEVLEWFAREAKPEEADEFGVANER
ncbi:MAG: DUF6166 domain-containing protein [Isosphaeraceae bacterium]